MWSFMITNESLSNAHILLCVLYQRPQALVVFRLLLDFCSPYFYDRHLNDHECADRV